MSRGEAFDIATGLPDSMLQVKTARTWLDFCAAYVAVRWDGAAAKTRDSITDSLATAAVVMVEDGHDRPDLRELRRSFLWAVLPANAGAETPEDLAAALR
jgi:hypothetical protein